MPKDVATFLANLAESRRAAQFAERSGFVPASGLVMPVALEVALRHRFLLTPALPRSRLATTSPPACLPSCEREQLEYWFAQYGEAAQWHLHLAESNVVTVEIDPTVARYSLEALNRDDDSWQRSLHFIAQGRYHFLFESAPRLPQLHGYPGLHVRAGKNSIVVPPSPTPAGIKLAYENEWVPLLPFPWRREPALPR